MLAHHQVRRRFAEVCIITTNSGVFSQRAQQCPGFLAKALLTLHQALSGSRRQETPLPISVNDHMKGERSIS